MDSNEKMLLEAVKHMLDDAVQLGLSYHGEKEERSHMTQFHWEDVEKMFRVKINQPEITYYELVSGAFRNTHSHKNIDDPAFELSFRKQMGGGAVPNEQQDLAIKYVTELREELSMPVRDTGRRVDNWSGSSEEGTGNKNLEDKRDATGTGLKD